MQLGSWIESLVKVPVIFNFECVNPAYFVVSTIGLLGINNNNNIQGPQTCQLVLWETSLLQLHA